MLNLNMTTSSSNTKQFPVWVINIRGLMLCFSYIACLLQVIVRTICPFENFEKLSMLLGFSRDILQGWDSGSLKYCMPCAILVNGINVAW